MAVLLIFGGDNRLGSRDNPIFLIPLTSCYSTSPRTSRRLKPSPLLLAFGRRRLPEGVENVQELDRRGQTPSLV